MTVICTYTGKNYRPCLDITLPTWKAEKIVVYSDTDEFGIKMFEPSEDFNESCRRKIAIIQRTIQEHRGENVLYLDTDVAMTDRVDEVFEKTEDIIATRMARRERLMPVDVNAGVIFWKAKNWTNLFCERWKRLEKKNQAHRYPEQNAFHQLCLQGYDQQAEWSVSNVSENIYNFERDKTKEFLKDLELYKPKLIHLKTKRWQDEESMEAVNRHIKAWFFLSVCYYVTMSNKGEWITVAEYAKRKGIRSRQVVYNWIARGKIKSKEITKTVKRKLVYYE